MVRKSVLFSNVIVDIAFPRRSFVFSQSGCEVSASLTDVGGVPVGAVDLINWSLSLPRVVLVMDKWFLFAISRSDFPRRTALPLNMQSIELGANNISAKWKETSSSWIIPSR